MIGVTGIGPKAVPYAGRGADRELAESTTLGKKPPRVMPIESPAAATASAEYRDRPTTVGGHWQP